MPRIAPHLNMNQTVLTSWLQHGHRTMPDKSTAVLSPRASDLALHRVLPASMCESPAPRGAIMTVAAGYAAEDESRDDEQRVGSLRGG